MSKSGEPTWQEAEVDFMSVRGRELFGEFLAGDLLQVAITRGIQLVADTLHRRQELMQQSQETK